jgi:thioredoxin-related protein
VKGCRLLSLSCLVLWLAGISPVTSALSAAEVPAATNLAADAHVARDRGVPILLVITRADCGYCELLKSAVVLPMIISGEYEDRAIIREINIDTGPQVVNFEGRTVSPFSIANGYDALLTPTVLIVGPDGTELAKRLIGINNVDMYLWYLDRALAEGAATVDGRR